MSESAGPPLAELVGFAQNGCMSSVGRQSDSESDRLRRKLIQAGYRYAYSLVHHRQDAEDLIQQACLRVYRRKGDLTELRYLLVTVRNVFRDQVRRKSLVRFEPLHADSIPDPGSTDFDSGLHRLDVATILGRLGSNDRELLYLHLIEGFTADEIASMTDRSRGTVCSQLARAKRKLQSAYSTPGKATDGACVGLPDDEPVNDSASPPHHDMTAALTRKTQ